jgi:hypothetical protein
MADGSGHTPRLHALCASLKAGGVALEGCFFVPPGTRLGVLVVGREACPLKVLRRLAPEVMPRPYRAARTVFARDMGEAEAAARVMVRAAGEVGFVSRPVELNEGGSLWGLYCRYVFPEGSGEDNGAYQFDGSGNACRTITESEYQRMKAEGRIK